jgi:hypothetical protein
MRRDLLSAIERAFFSTERGDVMVEIEESRGEMGV